MEAWSVQPEPIGGAGLYSKGAWPVGNADCPMVVNRGRGLWHAAESKGAGLRDGGVVCPTGANRGGGGAYVWSRLNQ